MPAEAGQLIDRFPAGNVLDFVVTMPTALAIAAAPAPGSIPEHSAVRLHRSMPELGLQKGAVGTVVHVYADGEDYEVEFTVDFWKLCLATLSTQDLEVIDQA